MNLIPIEDIDDVRLAPYRDLKLTQSATANRTTTISNDVDTRFAFSIGQGHFIAEGRIVAQRLLESAYRVESLVVASRKIDWVETQLGKRPDLAELPVYCLPDVKIEQMIGFEFHSGILGCGLRTTPTSLLNLARSWFQPIDDKCQATNDGTSSLVALPYISQPENLGSILRSARALGVAGLLVDRRSVDPFSRRVLRVSMGHALGVPILKCDDVRTELQELRRVGFRMIGVEVDQTMIPLQFARPVGRQVLILGSEFEGLGREWLDWVDQVVGIPMPPEVDSMNVAVVAAIAMHQFCRRTAE